MKRRVWLFACLSLLSCPRQEGQIGLLDEREDEGLLPTFEGLLRNRTGLLLHVTSTVQIDRMGASVTIEDEKRLLLLGTGDFEFTANRRHSGSEAGDSVETLHAVRVGGDYYTRGSGGPFVKWDDSRDEPMHTAQSAWHDTLELAALASSCATIQRSDRAIVFLPKGAVCYFEKSKAVFEIREVSGEVSVVDRIPVSASFRLIFIATVAERQAKVSIQHKMELSSPKPDSKVAAPSDFIESRRTRPVKMIESVLSGLVETWGPGAPKVLIERQNSVRQGGDDVGGRH